MDTITNKKQYPSEQYLNELITNMEFAARAPVEVVRAMAAELQKRRKADSAEPVAWRYRTTDINGNPNPRWSFSEEPSLLGLYQPLYADPQQPLSFPDAMEPTVEAIKRVLPTSNPDEYAVCIGADMWNACRAAMLNAEPPHAIQTAPALNFSNKNSAPLHATPKGNRLHIAEDKLAEYSLSKREPQPTPESADRKMLKRLAVIMSGSDSGGEISALTVTAQSLVDRCKALALDKEKLAATESLLLEVKCPFPYGWGELKHRTKQDALFFSAHMVEGEEITELHRDIVSRTVDRLLKVISACQTDTSFNGPTTWKPASLEEVNKRIVRESTGIPSREAIIAGGVLVQCPQCYNDSYRLNFNGLTHHWCDKCANSITSEGK